ncbi:hypothetical protein BASA81_002504 [Batrachochytrium salamandrivorans]|nr:hypothetical protein BASA81_002504 [Batrachochytrium salamandrivorans]
MFSLCVLAARREPTQIDFDSNATLGSSERAWAASGASSCSPGGTNLDQARGGESLWPRSSIYVLGPQAKAGGTGRCVPPASRAVITKGGKTPEDSECVPVLDQIQPCDMLTEAAHQDWEN